MHDTRAAQSTTGNVYRICRERDILTMVFLMCLYTVYSSSLQNKACYVACIPIDVDRILDGVHVLLKGTQVAKAFASIFQESEIPKKLQTNGRK